MRGYNFLQEPVWLKFSLSLAIQLAVKILTLVNLKVEHRQRQHCTALLMLHFSQRH